MPKHTSKTKDELIAELQQAQTALSECESRLNQLESFGKIGSFESYPTAEKHFWSDAMYRLWGYAPGEISPGIDSIISNTHAEDREFVSQQFDSLIAEPFAIEMEFRRILKDGGVAHCLCRARMDRGPSGDPLRIAGFLQDVSECRAIEEKWLRDKKFLNETQVLSGTGGWEINLNTNECHWTDNLCRMFGYAPSELPEDKQRFFFEHVLHPDDVELMQQSLGIIVEENSIQSMEFRVRCKNGDIKYFHGVAKPDRIKDEKGQRILGANLDVTSRKRSVDALRRSEEKFRIIFEKAPIGITLFNEEGVVLECNPHLLSVFGASSPESYIGKNLLEALPNGLAKASVKDAIVNGRGTFEGYYTSFVTHKTVYLQTLNLEVAPNLFLGVVSDLTERKRAEEALQESEERYALIVKGSNDGIWDVDLRTNTIYQSPRLVRMLGYEVEEFKAVSGNWQDRVHPDDRGRVVAAVDNCLVGVSDTFSEEYRVRRKDGTYIWVFSQGITAKGADGQVLRIAGVYSDISERKQNEVELIRAKENAEAASQIKNAFLANMSHEIRTPLNGVIGLVQLLQSSRLDKEQKSLVAMIDETGRNLLKILNDILDLSRIEAGRLRIHQESFPLEAVIQPIIGAFAVEAKNKNLAFSCEVDSNVPSLLVGDVTRIRQVLYNLVGNALKYTDSGSIRIEVYCLPYARSEHTVWLHFAVLDTGIGISDDKLDSVFESFTQVETSYTKQHGGTGLGLAIVKNLIQRMGGTLSIVSELGQGTEVHVTLELSRSEGQRQPFPNDIKSGKWPIRECSILLVEDDPVNRIMASRLLEKMGCNVRIAHNGQEALQVLREISVDCVLMDIQMPVMDGLEATRRIRANASGDFAPGIPIVAVTAYAMEGDKQKFIDAGMNAYLSKPVDIEALKEVLSDILASTAPSVD